jgi:NAD(P)H-hydrate epimerase
VREIVLIPLRFDGKSETWDRVSTAVVDEAVLEDAFPPRPLDAHKGTFGTLLIAAGSINYTGAALLAGKAAYRSGAGLVQMAVPSSLHAALAGAFPEATWLMLPHEMGVIAGSAAEVIWNHLERATALAVGPGLGTENTTRDFLKNLLTGETGSREKGAIGFLTQKGKHEPARKSHLPPTVIDADGLRLLSAIPGWIKLLSQHCVLTPHPGEMAALTGLSVEEIRDDRIEVTRRFAREWNCVVVLKGAFSVIGEPGGECSVIPYAVPALASAGTGDVLTGIIGSLLAQGRDPYLAARAGAYLHVQAGMLTAEEQGTPVSVMAGDLLDAIPLVLEEWV